MGGSPFNFSIEAKDKGVQRLLQNLQERVRDMRPVFNVIGEIVHGSIQENFERGGRPRKWPQLKASTILQRLRERKWPGRILVRLGVAGGLMGAISYKPARDHVRLSANKPYATTHQFGARKGQFGTVTAQIRQHLRRITQAFGRPIEPTVVTVRAHTRQMEVPWGNIPARPLMVVQDEDWEEIKDTLADFLAGVRW